jgi:hypothetical protein
MSSGLILKDDKNKPLPLRNNIMLPRERIDQPADVAATSPMTARFSISNARLFYKQREFAESGCGFSSKKRGYANFYSYSSSQLYRCFEVTFTRNSKQIFARIFGHASGISST